MCREPQSLRRWFLVLYVAPTRCHGPCETGGANISCGSDVEGAKMMHKSIDAVPTGMEEICEIYNVITQDHIFERIVEQIVDAVPSRHGQEHRSRQDDSARAHRGEDHRRCLLLAQDAVAVASSSQATIETDSQSARILASRACWTCTAGNCRFTGAVGNPLEHHSAHLRAEPKAPGITLRQSVYDLVN